MPEMPHDELRSLVEAIRTRLQTELQTQFASLEEQQAQALAAARRDADQAADARLATQLNAVQEDWSNRLQSEVAAARAEAEQRATEAIRARAEVERRATDAAARAHTELEQAMVAERERARQEFEGERERARAELSEERGRLMAELETERLKVRALTAALEEARAETTREREVATRAAEAAQSRQMADTEALTNARATERQSQLAIVERLLDAVRTIAGARSLSDTMNALVSAAASESPRAALFMVSGSEVQGWRLAGFGDSAPDELHLPTDRDDVLAGAVTTGMTVSTATASAPAFAELPPDRAAIAVPITVGEQAVAVLYGDDGSAGEHEAPASWPEALQILGTHASVCLAQLTALRAVQAMAPPPLPGAVVRVPTGSEDDNSARRYARLLVSEIKLYNENAVRLGREKRDLLERLRPEIDRARRLYEDRVSPSVGARGLYFQQELVQTLANGDPALLGAASPPR
jgi:hypothetical protein